MTEGLKADIVSLALAGDIATMAKHSGLIDGDWQSKFPHNSSPYTSTIVFLVRNGNPKKIKDWDDMIRPGVEVITPNPKTGGGALWNYLAAWGYAIHRELGDFEALQDPSKKDETVMAVAKAKKFIGDWYQHVPILDALAIEPQVLLLDEPFGALDAKVRKGLRDWLRGLHDELNTTTILVTHDQEEALEVSDRVVVMNQAMIEQVGAPAEVFHHPASEFVMDFLGNVNVFHGRVNQGQSILENIRVGLSDPSVPDGEQANVYVRPHDITIDRSSNGNVSMEAIVGRINRAGVQAKLSLVLTYKEEIRVDISVEQLLELDLQLGDTVFVHPTKARVVVQIVRTEKVRMRSSANPN